MRIANGNVDRDEEYYLTDVIFLVEGTLFRVPRAPFVKTSVVFSDMFQLPAPVGKPLDGSSDEHPLRLDGIKKKDFRLLLSILVPRPLDHKLWRDWTQEDWFSVLDLAAMWEMDRVKNFVVKEVNSPSLTRRRSTFEWIEILRLSTSRRGCSKIRDKVVDKLTPSDRLPPIVRILLAREYRVAQWLVSGYKELVERNEIISVGEEQELGVHATVKLFRIQLIRDHKIGVTRRRLYFCEDELEELIRISFADELEAAEYTTP